MKMFFRIISGMGMVYLGLCLTNAAAQFNYIGMVLLVLFGSVIQTFFDYCGPAKTASK